MTYRKMKKRIGIIAAVLLALFIVIGSIRAGHESLRFLSSPAAEANRLSEQITIAAAKDNTLYENETGAISNGKGMHFFAGKTKIGSIRRGLIAFDILQAIPSGSTIVSATLELHMSKTIGGNSNVSLHAYTGDWGEGESDAPGNEGQGTAAAPNDSTWIHRFFDTDSWDVPGGDFVESVSASTVVGGVGFYRWTSDTMAAEMQACLDSELSSCGWLLMGDESISQSAKRFDTRENGTATNRPQLIVEYVAPSPSYLQFAPIIFAP